ncbi:parasitic phase-specific protein PSP-1 [Aureobasidium pullulans]|uniref:Parasitic phase-specific protein PSP-1 n=1 Tax=Aureobasidium pullulans TaxID=5580 RepID=A0A4S9LBY3_AURPU|nr:parasitic phase-specific protein PSP-1 [Aureobasidium pullulans]
MSILPAMFARAATRPDHCTQDTCPASYSIYGYAPNLGANAFFVAIFAISCLTFCYQARLYRKWLGFSIAMILGTALESVGYGSRLMLSADPFSATGFKLNIVLLTFAPAFLTAGIYLLLKHLTLSLNPRLSLLKPSLYTPIFVSCDLAAIILQGAGGAISAAAANGTDKKLLDLGVNVMIAGLSSQVVTLAIFAVLAGVFFFRMAAAKEKLEPHAGHLWQASGFRMFVISATLAFTFIFVRCAYRIAELKDGWGSPIMRRENEFIILDSVMISVAAVLLNIFHPGRCFRQNLNETAVDLSTMDQKDGDEESIQVYALSKAHA